MIPDHTDLFSPVQPNHGDRAHRRARHPGYFQGTRYVYLPTLPRDRAGRPALANVLETFFDGSTEKAVAALLDLSKTELSGDQLDRLSQLIDQARMEGR